MDWSDMFWPKTTKGQRGACWIYTVMTCVNNFILFLCPVPLTLFLITFIVTTSLVISLWYLYIQGMRSEKYVEKMRAKYPYIMGVYDDESFS